METKVYIVHWDVAMASQFSNEDFMQKAKDNGIVYSLLEFQEAFNLGEIDCNCWIRIV